MLRRLLLWDIDGTLLHTGGLGAETFDRAVEDTFGHPPPAQVAMAGKTNPQIVREYLAVMGIVEEDHHVPTVIGHLVRRLAESEAELRKGGEVCPGVVDVLHAVATNTSVLSSVLTGNVAANAVLKLTAFGLERWLDLEVGAFGSDEADRRLLVPIALTRAATVREARLSPADTWVIGDSPRDLECARAGGARCLLVGTGRTPTAELAALDPDAVLEDLSDTDVVLEILTGDL